jgi:hypothetical protein
MPLYIIAFLLPALTMWGGWILRAWLDGRFRVSVPENVRPAAELALHIIIGTALFALVFSTAAIINVLIDFFVQHHMAPEWLVIRAIQFMLS